MSPDIEQEDSTAVASFVLDGANGQGRLAEAGLAITLLAGLASLGLSAVLTDRLLSSAFLAAGGLAVYGVLKGAGWASASAAIGQAGLGLVVADGKSVGAAIAVTVSYTIIASLILCATHISFLGRRSARFAPQVLGGYLNVTTLVVTIGLVVSSAIVLVVETSVWPPWLFPAGLTFVALALGLWAIQINRHHHELGANRRRF